MKEQIKVNINNVAHNVMLAGEDIANPILLCVHGGPGQAETAYIKKYQRELEKHFIVARHDQRGAGFTGWKNVEANSLNVENLVADTIKITEFLLIKFGKQRIYIMGHSWGSIIAVLAVKNTPQYYCSYIGVSQVVDYNEAVKQGYSIMVEQAKKQNKYDVKKLLSRIGAPPYTRKKYSTYSRCIGKMAGFIKTKPKYGITKSILTSTEYSLADKIYYYLNAMKSAKVIFKTGIDINISEQVKELKIPVIFISGRHDISTPLVLVEKFYQNLISPQKQLFIMENSAHMPQVEEYNRFEEIILSVKNSYTE